MWGPWRMQMGGVSAGGSSPAFAVLGIFHGPRQPSLPFWFPGCRKNRWRFPAAWPEPRALCELRRTASSCGAGGFLLGESGFGGQAEGFDEAGLHFGGDVVDSVYAGVGRAYAITELLLAHGSFDDAKDRIGDFLGIACGVRE